MKIIGHRGAAGLELENTLSSIKRAKVLHVDGIEIDVRLTKDRMLVLSHDPDLGRVSANNTPIAHMTLEELKTIHLNNGERVLTLTEALKATGKTSVIIEVKEPDCATELLGVIDAFPEANITVASFIHDLAYELEELRPNLSIYLAERFHPIEIIRLVRTAKANGIDLNAWLLNPLTYYLARRRKLEIMVYTVNYPFMARFIRLFYPGVAICTDFPDRFINKNGKATNITLTSRK